MTSNAPTGQEPFDGTFGSLTLDRLGGVPFGAVLADPPWRFNNRTGKVAPEHRRLSRYDTLSPGEIAAMPVPDVMAAQAHCRLTDELPRVREAIGASFGHADELHTTRQALVWLRKVLAERYAPPSQDARPVADEVVQTEAGVAGWTPETSTKGLVQARALLGAGTAPSPTTGPTRARPGSAHVSVAEASTRAAGPQPGRLDQRGFER